MAVQTVTYINQDGVRIDEVFELWADQGSKHTFDWLLKRRIAYAFVGNLCNVLYPYSLIKEFNYHRSPEKIEYLSGYYRVKGYSIYSGPPSFNHIWEDEQYFLKGVCEPKEGDLVINGGACTGESTVWFADRVGKLGKVFAFEPSLKCISIIEDNLKRNNLNEIVKVVQAGLWNDNTVINFNDMGYTGIGSIKESGKSTIGVASIDSIIEKEKLDRLDLIKMDIEGAELNALKGASKALARFKPKLAISIYHKYDDIFEIPLFLKSMVPQYKLYLSQRQDSYYETMLFATV